METLKTSPLLVGQVLEVNPDDLLTDPAILQIRDWNGRSEQECTIPELARMIQEETQLEPGLCYLNADNRLVLFDGERRRQAIRLLRMRGAVNRYGEPFLFRILISEVETADQALRGAALSFTQKAALKPLEFTRLVALLRERYDWRGAPGTEAIAEHLGVSPATVTQAEKLSGTSAQTQEQIRDGELSASTALDSGLVDIALEDQPAVIEEAKALAARDAEGKAHGKAKPRVTVKHVRQAIRAKVPNAKLKAPKLSEVLDFAGTWTGAKAMLAFRDAFVAYGHGKASEGDVMAAWNGIRCRRSAK